MKRVEILKIAKSVGMQGMAGDVYTTESELVDFVGKIIAIEREACALTVETCEWPKWAEACDSRDVYAKAIRARGDA